MWALQNKMFELKSLHFLNIFILCNHPKHSYTHSVHAYLYSFMYYGVKTNNNSKHTKNMGPESLNSPLRQFEKRVGFFNDSICIIQKGEYHETQSYKLQ